MSAENDNALPEEAENQGAGAGDEIEALRAEVASLRDRSMRALAEVENVRKRAERERDETRAYAIAGFARALLPVADNFSRALAAVPADKRAAADDATKAILEGVEATARQLQGVLEQNGIKLIAAEGQRFDPHLHQAIAEVPSSAHAPGTVVTVVQPGYTIGERLLRPAMVTVAKAEAGAGAGGSKSDGVGRQIDTSA
jgi:molecular chaperone GrpE